MMLSTKHAMRWLLSLCGIVMGSWGNLADVRVNTYVVRTETYVPLPLNWRAFPTFPHLLVETPTPTPLYMFSLVKNV